jgi:HipA-like protein
MARRRRYEPLNVYLNSRLVGQLRRELSGAIEFQYDAQWLAWPHTLPVSLSLPLREDAYAGAPVSAVFENLLPDNDAIRNRIAARALAEGIDAYSRLPSIPNTTFRTCCMRYCGPGYSTFDPKNTRLATRAQAPVWTSYFRCTK